MNGYKIAVTWMLVALLAALNVLVVIADDPDAATLTPTPTETETPSDPLPASATDLSGSETSLAPVVAEPTPTPATAYIAVLVGEAVVPVGGRGSTEVFVSLVDLQRGVQQFALRLTFDPDVIRIAEDGAPLIATRPSVQVAEVDNQAGQLVIVYEGQEDSPLQSTGDWQRVATITWTAQREGKSVVGIDRTSQFVTADGEVLTPDAAYDGVVFARIPGTFRGAVHLQGRTDHGGAVVSASLSSARVDRTTTDKQGQFTIETSHGEGFYTLRVAMPGYVSAESEHPIKITVGTVLDVGEIVLLGGDVNGDDQVDVRDLSFVAWHLEDDDPQADINGDGDVDILDLSLLASNFGQVGPSSW
ncbi:MAG: hypothetical protein JXA09_04295 [Anaerolineae bacterium]|nr:hypothetical protein [Anaerolineae bacterium]